MVFALFFELIVVFWTVVVRAPVVAAGKGVGGGGFGLLRTWLGWVGLDWGVVLGGMGQSWGMALRSAMASVGGMPSATSAAISRLRVVEALESRICLAVCVVSEPLAT